MQASHHHCMERHTFAEAPTMSCTSPSATANLSMRLMESTFVMLFKWPYRKKSTQDRSSNRGGQGTGPLPPIHSCT